MSPTSNQSDQKERDRTQYLFNLTLAAVAGQVGCLTLIIVLAALFGGLWLDQYFQTESPIFTIVLMVASVPVTLVLMFWVVRKATARIRPSNRQKTEDTQEEA